MLKTILLIMCTLILVACHKAPERPVLGLHGELGLSCADCHGMSPPERRAPESSCISCHGDYDRIKELTKALTPNPHNSHMGQLRCTLCHTAHKPPVLYCNQCHAFDLQPK